MATAPPGEVTRLLESWQAGDAKALDELVPLVYRELRTLATRQLGKERRGHTLQTTALVHEAYLRLLGDAPQVKDRSHFLAVAARAMRRVLVDHARRHRSDKRGGSYEKISLEEAPELGSGPDPDLLALHEALNKLSEFNPRQAQLVELRYFGGLTNAEAAEVLGISSSTLDRDWQVARLWLHRRLETA